MAGWRAPRGLDCWPCCSRPAGVYARPWRFATAAGSSVDATDDFGIIRKPVGRSYKPPRVSTRASADVNDDLARLINAHTSPSPSPLIVGRASLPTKAAKILSISMGSRRAHVLHRRGGRGSGRYRRTRGQNVHSLSRAYGDEVLVLAGLWSLVSGLSHWSLDVVPGWHKQTFLMSNSVCAQ